MCQNFLNKESNAIVIAFGNNDYVLKVNACLDSRGQTTKNQVRNLGVILETDLSFSSHVKAVTKSAYHHLKNIARIQCFLNFQFKFFYFYDYYLNGYLIIVYVKHFELPQCMKCSI